MKGSDRFYKKILLYTGQFIQRVTLATHIASCNHHIMAFVSHYVGKCITLFSIKTNENVFFLNILQKH